MLRIYGDVLYTTAVAYGAGLIEAFIEEVNKLTAVAGGPYTGEACQAVQFDGSGSFDQEPGAIVSYEWDFTADGVFDQTTISPLTEYAYLQPFSGKMVLRVTDNDGFTDEDTAVVTITEDKTPPAMVCPSDVAVECSEPGGADATNPAIAAFLAAVTATDACDVVLLVNNDRASLN